MKEPRPRQGGASTILRNMSCAPRSQIQHRSPYRRSQCRGIVFGFRPDQDVVAGLLEAAGPDVTDERNFRSTLRNLIDAHAKAMQLPAVALVTDRAEPEDEQCCDFLSVITVQAKSSARIYLRDKVPNLDQIQSGRRIIVIIPQERK